MKKFNYKIVLITIGLILFESVFYLLSKLTFIEPFVLSSVIDNKLPLIEEFIYLYVFWYLMLFIIPYLIYYKNKDLFYQYVTVFMGCVLVSSIIFFIFPTTIVRGNFEVNNITTFILNFIYLTDTPALNCLPSMHCAICFVFMYYSFKIDLKWYNKVLINILSILIILSTLFIKQHVIWDAIAALVMVLIVIILVRKSKLDFNVKSYLKRIKIFQEL